MTGFVGIFQYVSIYSDIRWWTALPINGHIDDNLIDLYDNCSGLNYEPFKCSETNEYFTTDKIDPDNNVHNKLDVSSLYYTEEQFKNKYRSSDGIHVNPERSFRGTNDGPSSEARWALKGGSGGHPPEIFKNLYCKCCNLSYSWAIFVNTIRLYCNAIWVKSKF